MTRFSITQPTIFRSVVALATTLALMIGAPIVIGYTWYYFTLVAACWILVAFLMLHATRLGVVMNGISLVTGRPISPWSRAREQLEEGFAAINETTMAEWRRTSVWFLWFSAITVGFCAIVLVVVFVA